MQTIARMILTSLPTIGYETKPDGSEPITIEDAGIRKVSAQEILGLQQIAQFERELREFRLRLEALKREHDIASGFSWGDSEGVPTREELMLMEEDANASDSLTLALLYLEPPRNATSVS